MPEDAPSSRVPPTVTVGDCVMSALAPVRRRLGEPEVQHLHDAVRGDLDVRWFQIAVNDPFSCAASRRIGNLARDGERLSDRHAAHCRRSGKRVALHQLPASSARTSLRFLNAVNRADVGMIERGEHLRFALKAGEAVPDRE